MKPNRAARRAKQAAWFKANEDRIMAEARAQARVNFREVHKPYAGPPMTKLVRPSQFDDLRSPIEVDEAAMHRAAMDALAMVSLTGITIGGRGLIRRRPG